jgi:hypothetical protein
MNLSVEAMVAEGDTVAVRFIETGTFSSPVRGIPATGKSYEAIAMDWFVLRDGKIVQRWGARDSAAIFRQMGVPFDIDIPIRNSENQQTLSPNVKLGYALLSGLVKRLTALPVLGPPTRSALLPY